MGNLNRGELSDQGMISVVDALVFILAVLAVSIFIFQMFSASFSQRQEMEVIDIKNEVALNIQNTVIHQRISTDDFEDITVERGIRNCLYFENSDTGDEKKEDLEEEIKEIYKTAAFEISQYRFAVSADYTRVEESDPFFVSPWLENIDELPDERSVSIYTSTLAEDVEEGEWGDVRIILYIWT